MLKSSETFDEYRSQVKTYVMWYMETNLGLKKDNQTLGDYKMIEDSAELAYYACRGQVLSNEMIGMYANSYLAKQHLTMIYDVRDMVLVEDKDISSSQAEVDEDRLLDNQDDDNTSQKILKWNFPTFGDLFLDILENFVTESTLEEFLDNPSVAGFWLERMFFTHHKKGEASNHEDLLYLRLIGSS